jgi:hypothetical protein
MPRRLLQAGQESEFGVLIFGPNTPSCPGTRFRWLKRHGRDLHLSNQRLTRVHDTAVSGLHECYCRPHDRQLESKLGRCEH